MIRDLFINTTILATFIFLSGYIFRNESPSQSSSIVKKVFTGVGGGLLGIVLMLYSIHISEHTILDFRFIAITLLMMSTSSLPTFICTIILILFRVLYFGFNISSATSIFGLLLIFLGSYLIWKIKASRFVKWMLMNIYSLTVVSGLVIWLMKSFEHTYKILLIFWAISLLTAGGLYYAIIYIERVNEAFRKLKRQATMDALTGINNVRSFDKAFNDFVERVKTHNEKLSLLLIDIDHFKMVNDTYGHPAGDEVLRQLASTIKSNSRSFDVVSRVGGEEFSVLLPDCVHNRAFEVAERIRRAVEEKLFILPDGTEINITVSVGVSTLSIECIDKKDNFINEADQGLYLAKRTGRNKVCSIIENKCTDGICNCV